MFKDFRKFILRGNAVDLAVGIVVGAAFTSVINSLVKDMITPVVTVFSGQQQFSDSVFTIRGSVFHYGDFINALTSFLIVALVVFFFVVQPINRLVAIANRSKTTDEPTTKKCPHCLSTIPKKATRCMYCTSKLKTVED